MSTQQAKVTDPVCGMKFYEDRAWARVERDGETYYFCSDACRSQFEADPARFANAT